MFKAFYGSVMRNESFFFAHFQEKDKDTQNQDINPRAKKRYTLWHFFKESVTVNLTDILLSINTQTHTDPSGSENMLDQKPESPIWEVWFNQFASEPHKTQAIYTMVPCIN